MDITQFISTLSQSPDTLSGIFVYVFSVDISCRVIYTELVRYAQKTCYPDRTLIVLDGEIHAIDTILPQVTAPFFGPNIYSVKNTQAYKLLAEYQGPHSFFIHELIPEHEIKKITTSQSVVITVPDKVTPELYKLYAREFYGITDTLFIDQLFAKRAVLTCDQAFLMLSYQRILGSKAVSIFTHWFDKLCEPEYSLFTLSSQLFAGQHILFFKLWITISREYSPEFWTIFWAEQLWQAIIFIETQKTSGFAEAKRAVSRLPFSFMQKDWRRYTREHLLKAHTALCALDSAIKNGAEFYILENWFYTFFFKTLI